MLPDILILTFALPIAAPISYLSVKLIPRPILKKMMDVAYSSVASVAASPMFDNRPGIRALALTGVMVYTSLRATWLR